MNLIKSAVFVYDTVTLPGYYLANKPWANKSGSPGHKCTTKVSITPSTNAETGLPEVTIVRTGDQPVSHLDSYGTIDSAMRDVFGRFSSKPCLGYREVFFEEEIIAPESGKRLKKKILAPAYKWFTFAQVDKLVDDCSRGILSLDLAQSGDRVVIFSETRMEWLISFHALLRLNCPVVTLYANLGSDGIVHVLNQTEATVAIVSSEVINKLTELRGELKYLRHLILLESKGCIPIDTSQLNSQYNIVPWSTLLSTGGSSSPHLKPKEVSTENSNALIMYTSGSTGVPKGVVISHKNFLTAVRAMNTILDQYHDKNGVHIGYLPLAHIYECVVEHCIIMMGLQVGYSSPFTLTNNSPGIKSGVDGDLTVLKPRLLCGVPLILDRIRKEVTKLVEAKGGLAAKMFHFGLDYKNYWMSKGFETPLMDKLVFSRTLSALGGKLVAIVSGGAPLSVETQYFARACFSCSLIVGYSATEVCAAGTCMDLGDMTLGNVGFPLFGIKIRLIPWEEAGYSPDDKPYPRGEIVIGGDTVAMGYYKNEEESESAFKVENGIRWFYTGDIGEMLPDGKLRIIDRRKDLVKLQFGEYISLGKVESGLSGNPLVESICVYGDGLHNYTIALIVPNSQSLKLLASKISPDLADESFEDLCDNPKVNQVFVDEIGRFSMNIGLNKYEIPRKIKLCKEEWTPDSGLVTAAMKIRRNELKKFYARDIELMYSDNVVDQNQNLRKI
uniref:long-chain-fatty-acid--CoA ligase n=2 Tax=Tetranychus urticae TaxID=32264 RepID=T1JTE5_TETUR